jgi:two-component system KDP operon response regulator KdpE
LVAGEEPQALRALAGCVQAAGYEVATARTAGAALEALALTRIDGVLLDLGLSDLNGVGLCARIREWSSVPVIVLSGDDREDTKISVLDSGADDYVAKPYAAGELLARLRAVGRRRYGPLPAEPLVAFGAVEVDLARREVRLAEDHVHLTPHEYGLLAELCHHLDRVVTHRQLLERVWGAAYADDTQYLYVYMASLRRKLEREPSRPRHLLTEPGVGYRLSS